MVDIHFGLPPHRKGSDHMMPGAIESGLELNNVCYHFLPFALPMNRKHVDLQVNQRPRRQDFGFESRFHPRSFAHSGLERLDRTSSRCCGE
ncbi:hypothetical protein AVEN_240713-1 [Araneus ventricosus]|uniref:Uncharacterized protein n=1 Tax=Araneus ventricosus TaxID=182803 RepID=A0A4Y2JQU3_ARAVE|nr:hypothetical protein AVEN_240713-1 [Araneus ventricosus]